ncbi:purine permease [Nocardiopsis sp. HNM0947]|uniref:Purine permease n=1 Tax=Nocardiopsis coralli TaxID=2772213 RepID=A0ABR9PB30_9ACTN|nr:nucleobase:cation symporter-2 family protein [Nocardiopsis coralli]MBE3001042.1 purine permease [Nocardiopsis coralli]
MKFPKGARGESPAPDGPAARPEDARPPARWMFTYGLQHILAMYAGVITPPIIIAEAVGLDGGETAMLISAALLVSGLATLLQTLGVWRFGAQLPLVIGTSFVPVSAMTGIGQSSGLPAVFGAAIAAGVFGLIAVPFVASLIRFFPPLVTGTVITVIGVTLLPVAVGWIQDDPESGAPSTPALAMAGGTLLIILILSKVLPGVWSRMAILIGLVLGTLGAAAFGQVDPSEVGQGPVVSVGQPFYFGAPEFQVAAIVTMCVVMIVILAEGVADILAVGQVVGTKVDGRRLADGLRADAATAVVGPFLNSFPGSTFSQNVGLIALNKVRSRHVVATGGGILVAMGLFPYLGQIVAMIPSPVLGGAGLVLFGSVAAAGIRTLSEVDYDGNHNLMIVAVSMAFGVLPIAAPDFFTAFPEWAEMILHSGIVTAAVSALLLNAFFNMWGSSADHTGGPGPGESSAPDGRRRE